MLLGAGAGAASAAQTQARACGEGEGVPRVPGCLSPSAVNFDSSATVNEGCLYTVAGCTDSNAINFVPNATLDDGSCIEVVHFDFLGRAPRAVAAETVNLEHHSENVPACRSVSLPCFPG